MSCTAKGTEYGKIGSFLSRQIIIRPNKKINVSGNGSENFRLDRHTYFSGKTIILCILKGI